MWGRVYLSVFLAAPMYDRFIIIIAPWAVGVLEFATVVKFKWLNFIVFRHVFGACKTSSY